MNGRKCYRPSGTIRAKGEALVHRVLSLGKAPLQLVAGSTAGAPTTSGHIKGELYVDSNGILYYFNGSAWKIVQLV